MRDRTRELRKDEDSSDDEAIQLVINSGKEEINEQFFHQVREVRQGISQLQVLVEDLKHIQLHILSCPVPSEEEKERLQNERDEIKVVASRVRGQLKEMEKSRTTGEEDPFSVAARTRCTQHNVLTREFVDVMNLCHSEQSEYRNRNVERIHRQLKITGHQLSEEELEMMLETGKQDIFTANILQDTQFTRQALNEMESRHTEILRLEKSISELHDMFMYLAFEVEAQGEMINNIENTVVSTVNYVEKAAVNTASAANSQRKALKKKICIIVCISLLLVVIISIILTVSLI